MAVPDMEKISKCPPLFDLEGVFWMSQEGMLSMEEADRAVVIGQLARPPIHCRDVGTRFAPANHRPDRFNEAVTSRVITGCDEAPVEHEVCEKDSASRRLPVTRLLNAR